MFLSTLIVFTNIFLCFFTFWNVVSDRNQLPRYFASGALSLSIKISRSGPATHSHPSFGLSFIVNEAVWQRMKITAVSFFLFLGAGWTRKSFWKSRELKKSRPHIVFILADDLGWNEVFSLNFGHLGIYHHHHSHIAT